MAWNAQAASLHTGPALAAYVLDLKTDAVLGQSGPVMYCDTIAELCRAARSADLSDFVSTEARLTFMGCAQRVLQRSEPALNRAFPRHVAASIFEFAATAPEEGEHTTKLPITSFVFGRRRYLILNVRQGDVVVVTAGATRPVENSRYTTCATIGIMRRRRLAVVLFTLQNGVNATMNDLTGHMTKYCDGLSRLPPNAEPAEDLFAPHLPFHFFTEEQEFTRACPLALTSLHEIPKGTPPGPPPLKPRGTAGPTYKKVDSSSRVVGPAAAKAEDARGTSVSGPIPRELRDPTPASVAAWLKATPQLVARMGEDAAILVQAVNELKRSTGFRRVLLIVQRIMVALDLSPGSGLEALGWVSTQWIKEGGQWTILLDYLVRVIDKQSPALLQFAAELPCLAYASTIDMRDMYAEVRGLSDLAESKANWANLPGYRESLGAVYEVLPDFHERLGKSVRQLESVMFSACEDHADFLSKLATGPECSAQSLTASLRTIQEFVADFQASVAKLEQRKAAVRCAALPGKQAQRDAAAAVARRASLIVDSRGADAESGEMKTLASAEEAQAPRQTGLVDLGDFLNTSVPPPPWERN